MLIYLVFGLIFLSLGIYFEQKRKAKRTYRKVMDWISTNKDLLENALEQISQDKNHLLPGESIERDYQMYLVTPKDQDVKTIPLKSRANNEKISFPQYQNLIKKLKKEQAIYQYTYNSISVYYRFCSSTYILWVKCTQPSIIFTNKTSINH